MVFAEQYWHGYNEKTSMLIKADVGLGAVATDYCDVLSEILTRRINNPATNEVFPDY
jgi:hypothetical protein